MEKVSRTKIADLLKSDALGTTVNVKGWVRTRRGSKQINFIALNDGSTIHNLQIVVDIEKFGEDFLKPITTGACVSVNGTLTASQGSGQKVEVQASEIEIYGTADPATYPLQKKRALYGVFTRNSAFASAYQYVRSGVPHSPQYGYRYP